MTAADQPPALIVTETKPFGDQRPGTSGLRKKVEEFRQENYLANFVQALFNSLPEADYKGQTLLVSGDGRYWNKEAIHIISEIAAGNGVERIWVGQNGWMSTPAASAVIRNRENGICKGGLILTASHNPGGKNGDFGIKFNGSKGEPAPERVTEAIFEATKRVSEIFLHRFPMFDLTRLGCIEIHKGFVVEIIDPMEDWIRLMKSIFDFDLLRKLVKREGFSFVYDGMHGIGGPYAEKIFVNELGASRSCLMRCDPQEDFGGCHPDPNLTYADELVKIMNVRDPLSCNERTPLFGAAGDGDCDRNMILGRGWFVTPSDSVAIMAAHVRQCVPYFKNRSFGVARSMPTSLSLKIVADKLGLPHYEVPTGWKFFGNLMDEGLISLCGEESFGTGSDHIREKDGLWAVLVWMSILAYKSTIDKPASVREINQDFWKEYGRNYYTRYDYEDVKPSEAEAVMAHTRNHKDPTGLSHRTKQYLVNNPIKRIDVFEYIDPVDKSKSSNQGVRCFFEDGSRFVLRLSGTGSSGATVRLYIEKYQPPGDIATLLLDTATALTDLVQTALDISNIEKLTGREKPSVIT